MCSATLNLSLEGLADCFLELPSRFITSIVPCSSSSTSDPFLVSAYHTLINQFLIFFFFFAGLFCCLSSCWLLCVAFSRVPDYLYFAGIIQTLVFLPGLPPSWSSKSRSATKFFKYPGQFQTQLLMRDSCLLTPIVCYCILRNISQKASSQSHPNGCRDLRDPTSAPREK